MPWAQPAASWAAAADLEAVPCWTASFWTLRSLISSARCLGDLSSRLGATGERRLSCGRRWCHGCLGGDTTLGLLLLGGVTTLGTFLSLLAVDRERRRSPVVPSRDERSPRQRAEQIRERNVQKLAVQRGTASRSAAAAQLAARWAQGRQQRGRDHDQRALNEAARTRSRSLTPPMPKPHSTVAGELPRNEPPPKPRPLQRVGTQARATGTAHPGHR